MKIYTKTGDTGETSLYGGERLSKTSLRIQVCGTVDECNSTLGLARTHLTSLEDKELAATLDNIQNTLFNLGADLATKHGSSYRENIQEITPENVRWLEHTIDNYSEQLPHLKKFILPGGHPAAAILQLARAITRRAEREAVTLSSKEKINKEVLVYLNRLSDTLFILARAINVKKSISEPIWQT